MLSFNKKENSMKKRFTEEQIITILKEVDSGITLKEVCRKHGISSGSYYKWKAKFGGMEVSEAQRLRALEAENAKLKRLVADQALDIVGLKDILSKKW
jgi:putative transposase